MSVPLFPEVQIVLRKRLLGGFVVLAMVGAPIMANAIGSREARHTIEVLDGYHHGCKTTGGWMKRAWRHDPDADGGPEADPNYPGRMWDFRCKVPAASDVPGGIPTATVTLPGATVTVPGPTVTQTVTVTASPSCSDPDSNGDEHSNNHNGNGDDGDEDCD